MGDLINMQTQPYMCLNDHEYAHITTVILSQCNSNITDGDIIMKVHVIEPDPLADHGLQMILANFEDLIYEAPLPEAPSAFTDRQIPRVILIEPIYRGAINDETLSKFPQFLKFANICVVTSQADQNLCSIMLNLGARGYLVKSDISAHLLRNAIRIIGSNDGIVLSASIASIMMCSQSRTVQTSTQLQQTPMLTVREHALLEALARGSVRQAIARDQQISLRTLERHISLLQEKLKADSPFMLGVNAAKLGLI